MAELGRRFSMTLYLRGLFRISAVLVALVFGLAPVWAGTIQTFRYASPALGQEQTAQVYLPAGDAPKGGWPVLYLLHGLNGAATDWDRLGRLRTTVDKMIGDNDIKPLLIVMPSAGNSWYVDSGDVKGPGNYATAISHDLEQAVESAFPVGRDRSHRAIAGLSMGGFGALRLGLSEPARYGAIAALSPAIWQNIPSAAVDKTSRDLEIMRGAYFQKTDNDTVTTGIVLPPDGAHFGGAFGTPFDARRFNAANVFTLLERAVESKKNLPSIYLTVGDDDSHLLWRGAIAFFETMRMDGRMIDFRVTDGDHNWDCWKSSLGDALQFIDHNMIQPPA
ncbi:alpha/beta hydrolase [Lichenifustis flavocetrariae]|uniref:Esterase family protein n=1 Tax=Lichenifustis flavocetrariae TaxID=2949735 RepID=A0AA41YWT5_9HYPH|nr:alpha/beta hydrolase family protein [Lichenifustis flavocetrariae]MCW6508602.1 esterase family protein [Lichenifustis flavocetrariae]